MKTNYLKTTNCSLLTTNYQKDIEKALEVLRQGGVILYPTDTIWGLGCDATNVEAVKRIYQIKKRSNEKSMLLLVDCIARLNFYVEDIPDVAYDLIDCSERPLTIIYERGRNLPPDVLSSDGSIGIRVTKEVFSNTLCSRLGRALVSTSANISGEKAPKYFKEISEEVKKSVDFIVNYRQEDTTPTLPSSIIKLNKGGVFQIIRS